MGASFTARYDDGAQHGTVEIAGEFNGWTPAPLVKDSGDESTAWSTVVSDLEAGRSYAFKFIVDGDWRLQPGATNVVTDEHGNQNHSEIAEADEANAADSDGKPVGDQTEAAHEPIGVPGEQSAAVSGPAPSQTDAAASAQGESETGRAATVGLVGAGVAGVGGLAAAKAKTAEPAANSAQPAEPTARFMENIDSPESETHTNGGADVRGSAAGATITNTGDIPRATVEAEMLASMEKNKANTSPPLATVATGEQPAPKGYQIGRDGQLEPIDVKSSSSSSPTSRSPTKTPGEPPRIAKATSGPEHTIKPLNVTPSTTGATAGATTAPLRVAPETGSQPVTAPPRSPRREVPPATTAQPAQPAQNVTTQSSNDQSTAPAAPAVTTGSKLEPVSAPAAPRAEPAQAVPQTAAQTASTAPQTTQSTTQPTLDPKAIGTKTTEAIGNATSKPVAAAQAATAKPAAAVQSATAKPVAAAQAAAAKPAAAVQNTTATTTTSKPTGATGAATTTTTTKAQDSGTAPKKKRGFFSRLLGKH